MAGNQQLWVFSETFCLVQQNCGMNCRIDLEIPQATICPNLQEKSVIFLENGQRTCDSLAHRRRWSLTLGLNSDCSVDLAKISRKFLKENIDVLVSRILYTCKLPLSTEIFPRINKRSWIHPIYKGGDRVCAIYYILISILPTLSKILEISLILSIIWLQTENIYISITFFKLTQHIVYNYDNKKKTIGVSLDLVKAFDSLDPHFGIETSTLWYQGYPVKTSWRLPV